MARPKAFDQDKALNQAMALFWQQGYEATSIQELLDVMGIGRGSLYDTFGDKRQLFLAALQRYQSSGDHSLVAPLRQFDSAKEAIRQLFINLVNITRDDPDQKGCLIVNSAVELAPHDPHMAEAVSRAQNNTEELFYQAILHGQEMGEIPSEKEPRALARFFVNNIRGIRVMAKYNPDLPALHDIIRTALSVLD